MNITKEQIDDLNAIIQIEITPEDYQEKFEKQLRDYRKKANMPGFRPGNVPMGVIKKMYGNSALIDIIDKMTSENLFNFIKENELDIIGAPLTNEEKNLQPDFAEGAKFNFFFDIALSPSFEVNLEEMELTYYNISMDNDFIEKQINSTRQRYGTSINPEFSEENDRIFGKFEELNENNEVVENGITNKSSVLPKMIKDNGLFVGLKKEDTLTLNMNTIFDNNIIEISSILGVSKEKAEEIKNPFKFTVEDIFRIEPCALDEEFYKKIFPYSEIKSYEEFKEEFEKEYKKQNNNQSDVKFINDVHKMLLEKTNLTLPDAFLKRWILQNDEEGKLTKEKLEEDYDKYADSMRWQLIENKIIKTHNISVGQEDVTDYVMSWFKRSGEDEETEELRARAHEFAQQMMKNKEESKRIYDKLYDDKMMNLFKEKIKISEKEINWDEFIKLA